ncbi:MAG: LysM domain-containing protein [Myxococcota bacterium]|nr:LysM domain-containing protein [Myxococcota bacterium]
MTRPTLTRSALALIAIAGCGGKVPETSRVGEADPVVLSSSALPDAMPAQDTGAPATPAPIVTEELTVAAPPAAPVVDGVDIAIRIGENLVGIASVAGVSVEELAEANDLDPREPLHPGQHIRIPVSGALAAAFAEARDFARAGRLDTYVSGRGGLVGVESHAVRTGETAWEIARERAGVPVWVLSAFNDGTSLDSLGIGQRIRFPVFADSVAAAEPESSSADAPVTMDPAEPIHE